MAYPALWVEPECPGRPVLSQGLEVGRGRAREVVGILARTEEGMLLGLGPGALVGDSSAELEMVEGVVVIVEVVCGSDCAGLRSSNSRASSLCFRPGTAVA